jgi:hypothetical protein
MKLALAEPNATVTLAGAVSAAVLLERATTAPAAAAALDNITVQVEAPPGDKVSGAHDTPVNEAGAIRVTLVVREPPFRVAVTVTVWSTDTVPATATKLAIVAPDGTVTADGALRAATSVDSATTAPPAPAAFDNVTVQVELAPVTRRAGLQEKPLIMTDVTNAIVVVREAPFSVAVIPAFWSVENAAVVAEKIALVAPDPTVTAFGTFSAAKLLDSATTAPAAPAAFDRVTVQVEFRLGPRLAGLQDSPLSAAVATSEIDTVRETPATSAVTVAV